MPRVMLRHDNLVWQRRKFDGKVRSLVGDHVVMWCVSGRDMMGMDVAVNGPPSLCHPSLGSVFSSAGAESGDQGWIQG